MIGRKWVFDCGSYCASALVHCSMGGWLGVMWVGGLHGTSIGYLGVGGLMRLSLVMLDF